MKVQGVERRRYDVSNFIDSEHALHQKLNLISMAVVQRLILSMRNCASALGFNEGHTQVPDTLY